ncbi:MAG: hypothetical protein QGH51_02520 [Planctomycetota bacterium]|jgi:hypothetical protein|nr:hypothetical protein [Planctomycetota bacterium]MDP6940877.1 hypothetical protein [Planctomycetota bacterium]
MKAKALLLPLFLAASCSGVHYTDGTFSAHAESFVLFGFEIPGDDMAAARAEVPNDESVTITSVSSSPDDWSSLFGILNNIIGVHCTQISGTYTE